MRIVYLFLLIRDLLLFDDDEVLRNNSQILNAIIYSIIIIHVIFPLTYLMWVFIIWRKRWQIAKDLNIYYYGNPDYMNPNYVELIFVYPNNQYHPQMDLSQNNEYHNGGSFYRIVGYQLYSQQDANLDQDQVSQNHNH